MNENKPGLCKHGAYTQTQHQTPAATVINGNSLSIYMCTSAVVAVHRASRNFFFSIFYSFPVTISMSSVHIINDTLDIIQFQISYGLFI